MALGALGYFPESFIYRDPFWVSPSGCIHQSVIFLFEPLAYSALYRGVFIDLKDSWKITWISFATRRNFVLVLTLWNQIGCRRWLHNELIGLVRELQCLLLVNGYTERPFGRRQIHYIATPCAVRVPNWWRSVKHMDLSFSCFMWLRRDAVALLLSEISPIVYFNILDAGWQLFYGAPVDSCALVNQYLRQDLISLVCFRLSSQTPGNPNIYTWWWMDQIHTECGVLPCFLVKLHSETRWTQNLK